MNDWTTDNLTNNKWLFNCDKRQAPMTLWVFIANNITVYRQSRPNITSYLSWPINQLNQSNRVNNQSLIPSTAWHNSLWLWRWLPHRLSKRQSLSTTTVIFRTTFTQTIKLNLLLRQLNPWKSLPFRERGLDIGGDGKRGSGGMATALSPSVCLMLSLKKYFRRERSDDRKCVCCSQASL